MTTLVLFLLASVIYQAEGTYDCRRPEQRCLNGGKCTFASPNCTDCPGYSGYDCGVLTVLIGASPCDTADPCKSGDCWNNNGVANCYCPESKYGDNCEEDRLGLSCDIDFMVLGVNPLTTTAFAGVAYVQGKRNESACRTLAVPAVDPNDDVPDTWMGQYIKINHTSDECGNITAKNESGKITYTRVLVVQFNEKLITFSDVIFTAKCTFDENGVLLESDISQIDTDDLDNLDQRDNEGQFSPVTLTVTSGGVAVGPSNPIKVGADVVFTFTIPEEYEDLRIESTEANNTKLVGDTDAEVLPIITDSCVDDKAFHIIRSPPDPVSGSKRNISMTIGAFHFDGNDQVVFRFIVKVCQLEGDCDPVNCTNEFDGMGYGRKKREASANEEVIERVLTIVDADGITQKDGSSSRDCQPSRETTAALVCMGIVIITLLILLTILLGKFLMSRPQSKEDLVSSQSTRSLPRK